MRSKKTIKQITAVFFIILCAWVATPKVYIHDLLHHHHAPLELSSETKVRAESADDCNFENYNKPSYFSIFKFVCSFIPVRKHHTGKNERPATHISEVFFGVALFRGPPVTA